MRFEERACPFCGERQRSTTGPVPSFVLAAFGLIAGASCTARDLDAEHGADGSGSAAFESSEGAGEGDGHATANLEGGTVGDTTQGSTTSGATDQGETSYNSSYGEGGSYGGSDDYTGWDPDSTVTETPGSSDTTGTETGDTDSTTGSDSGTDGSDGSGGQAAPDDPESWELVDDDCDRGGAS